MNITEISSLTVLVSGSFAATNLDNLLLLVVLIGANPRARLSIVLGFLTATAIVLLVSCLGILIGANVDPALLGYLGIVPLAMGGMLLYRQQSGLEARVPEAITVTGGGWIASTVLMLSNSGDTLAIFLPLLAESSPRVIWWVIGLFAGVALAWAILALAIADNLGAAQRIVRIGNRLVPWIMVAAGTYILLDTATDSLLSSPGI